MNEAHNEFVDYKKATALFATMGWQMPDHQPQIVLRPSLDADFRFEKQQIIVSTPEKVSLLQRNIGEISLLINCGKAHMRRLSPNVA